MARILEVDLSFFLALVSWQILRLFNMSFILDEFPFLVNYMVAFQPCASRRWGGDDQGLCGWIRIRGTASFDSNAGLNSCIKPQCHTWFNFLFIFEFLHSSNISCLLSITLYPMTFWIRLSLTYRNNGFLFIVVVDICRRTPYKWTPVL